MLRVGRPLIPSVDRLDAGSTHSSLDENVETVITVRPNSVVDDLTNVLGPRHIACLFFLYTPKAADFFKIDRETEFLYFKKLTKETQGKLKSDYGRRCNKDAKWYHGYSAFISLPSDADLKAKILSAPSELRFTRELLQDCRVSINWKTIDVTTYDFSNLSSCESVVEVQYEKKRLKFYEKEYRKLRKAGVQNDHLLSLLPGADPIPPAQNCFKCWAPSSQAIAEEPYSKPTNKSTRQPVASGFDANSEAIVLSSNQAISDQAATGKPSCDKQVSIVEQVKEPLKADNLQSEEEEGKIKEQKVADVELAKDEGQCPILANPEVEKENDENAAESTGHASFLLLDDTGSPVPNRYNILLVGPSGAGKSTLINSIANYFSTPSFADALVKPFVSVLPSHFDVQDDDYIFHTVAYGADENEHFNTTGQSVTQEPRVHQLRCGEVTLNIIDTPGLNDSRGVEQDEVNIQLIRSAIKRARRLHAVCFVLHPNESKLSSGLHFVLRSLLDIIPAEAFNNICFFFTNSCSTFFRPGDTIRPIKELRSMLEAENRPAFPFGKKNVFCVESDAFRYLVVRQQNQALSYGNSSDFEINYTKSQQAISSFLKFVQTLPAFATCWNKI